MFVEQKMLEYSTNIPKKQNKKWDSFQVLLLKTGGKDVNKTSKIPSLVLKKGKSKGFIPE